MSKNKGKGPSVPLAVDLHCTLPQQLETSISRLQALDAPQVILELHQPDDDRAAFRLRYWRDGRISARAEGVLRRWQGTSTRVDCDGEASSQNIVRVGGHTVLFSFYYVMSLFWTVLLLHMFLLPLTGGALSPLTVLLALPLAYVLADLLYHWRDRQQAQQQGRRSSSQVHPDLRDLDRLMQALAQALQTPAPGETTDEVIEMPQQPPARSRSIDA